MGMLHRPQAAQQRKLPDVPPHPWMPHGIALSTKANLSASTGRLMLCHPPIIHAKLPHFFYNR
jgi:hypothetical protein